MQSLNYRGWFRLGTVLSAVWVIGVLVYAAYDYHTVSTDLTSSANPFQAIPPPPEGFEVVGQQSLLTECTLKQKAAICSPRLINLAALSLLPIGLVWLVTSLSVFAFLWIRAGFKNET